MAELTLWGFRSGTSLLHRLDPRFSLLAMALVSLTTLRAEPKGLLLLFIACIGLCCYTGLGIRQLVSDLRWVVILLVLIVAARGLTTPGNVLLDSRFLPLTAEGLLAGGLIAWRLLTIVLFGVLFMRSTPPSGVRAAVEWYLTPVPWVPQARVGMMIGLLLRFIPLIFRLSADVGDAQRARGVDNTKNPLRRMLVLVMPLMRRLFLTADDLAAAMIARGYREDRTPAQLATTALDWNVLMIVVVACAGVLLWS